MVELNNVALLLIIHALWHTYPCLLAYTRL